MKPANYVIGFAVSAAIVGCDSDRPSTPLSGGPEPTPVRLTLTGNTRLTSLGETSQLMVTVEMSNGTTQTPDNTAITWIVVRPNVATVSREGLLTAIAAGETTVEASYSLNFRRVSAARPVLVLPDGAFILRGTVTEPGFPLDQVTVEVVSGAGSGRSVVTDFNGRYALYGLEGDLTLRASKSGYTQETRRVQLNADGTVDFALFPNPGHVQLAPRYTLTLIASETCGDKLAEEFKSRTYNATVTQNSARVDVQLEGPTFWSSGDRTYNRFDGRARGNTVEFFLGDPFYYDDYDIVEQIAEDEYFTFAGSVRGMVQPAGFTASLTGYLWIFDAPDGPYGRSRNIGYCDARDHQIVFSRR